MLTAIGRPAREEGLIGLLLECHERIRRFAALSRRLAAAPQASTAEVRETASKLHHYFGGAMPLHVRDEEESLLPRLRGRDTVLDGALAEMKAQHDRHAAPLGRLVEICAALRDGHLTLAASAAELGPLTLELERDLERHLELEERVVFPAVRTLDPALQAAILAEHRARRAADGG